MLRQGPIPAFLHGLLEYVVGAFLVAAPLLLNYHHGAATAASVIIGVTVIVMAAATTSSTSLVNQLPLPVHVLLDYVVAAVLIASPFLFAFKNETRPTAIFIAGGVLHLLVSIGTRFRKEDAPARGSRRQRRRAAAAPPVVAAERDSAVADPLPGRPEGDTPGPPP
ncbi:MAG: hypothetical protein NVSMB25_18550 [Thermoleophilaceae bacterium]